MPAPPLSLYAYLLKIVATYSEMDARKHLQLLESAPPLSLYAYLLKIVATYSEMDARKHLQLLESVEFNYCTSFSNLVIFRDYHMAFWLSPTVSSRDPIIKPESFSLMTKIPC